MILMVLVLNKQVVNIKSRDILATQDIDGTQPDPFKNRERTQRFNRNIKKLQKGKGSMSNCSLNGKYSNNSQISDVDKSSNSAYINHFEYIQPKQTKFLNQSRRYYINHHKNQSNINFQANKDYDFMHPLEQSQINNYNDEGEGEGDKEDDLFHRNILQHNEDYSHIQNSGDYFQPGQDYNNPLSRERSQEKQLEHLLHDGYQNVPTMGQNYGNNSGQSYDENNVQNQSYNIGNIRIK